MRTCSGLLLAAVATIVCAVASLAAADTCPWRTVAHVDDPFIQNLGKWAVEQQHTVLRFDKVESARAQDVGECTSTNRNYELIIDASNRAGPGDDKYRAVVYVIEKIEPQKVLSFHAVIRSRPPPAN
ncbi:putative cysteine proteinase inhibitor 7 [Phragmites australis]|uniref:putative cysteine proteinase inhibitor 7 n=1 Tax=Phragmites australis TaxID=29695 RepID=UPI002D789DF3|nr:putative cysteine proteinase inhibitor 7 [Phragmites australis]